MARQLFVDFELYAEGDPDFKKVLCLSMADNVAELQSALRTLLSNQNDMEAFRKVVHKITPTITMLNDPELGAGIVHVKSSSINTMERIAVVAGLLESTEAIIASLRRACE